MKLLITAGPTREPLDPVRYLSNRSSGKMGYSLAEAAQAQGHHVTLISGPVALSAPRGVIFCRVETAQEMWETTRRVLSEMAVDSAVHAAAVADYRPKHASAQKIKKHEDSLTLELERTPDVLGSMRSVFGFPGILVGFAAETENMVPNAMSKLQRKGCDLVIANDVSAAGVGFDSDDNEVTLCFPDGMAEKIARMKKSELAILLVGRIVELVRERSTV